MGTIVEYFESMPLSDIALSTQVTVESSETIRGTVIAMAKANTSCAFVMENEALRGNIHRARCCHQGCVAP